MAESAERAEASAGETTSPKLNSDSNPWNETTFSITNNQNAIHLENAIYPTNPARFLLLVEWSREKPSSSNGLFRQQQKMENGQLEGKRKRFEGGMIEWGKVQVVLEYAESERGQARDEGVE